MGCLFQYTVDFGNLLFCSSELVATIVRTFMVGDLSSFNDVINNNSIGFQPLKVRTLIFPPILLYVLMFRNTITETNLCHWHVYHIRQ